MNATRQAGEEADRNPAREMTREIRESNSQQRAAVEEAVIEGGGAAANDTERQPEPAAARRVSLARIVAECAKRRERLHAADARLGQYIRRKGLSDKGGW